MAFELNTSGVLVCVAWATVLLWLVGAFLTLRGLFRQQSLSPLAGRQLTGEDAPLVSVLVPARNEEHRVLGQSVRSMLAQDYGRFEVVAVNDRSTDGTGRILREVASEDARLRVVEGVDVPEGWLGKPHALQQSFDASGSEWVLATDADMIFETGALRTAVAHALAGRFDAVTLLPHVDCPSFWERVFMPTFGWLMLVAMPLERVNDPRRPESLGVGGFFLIRRASLDAIGGYHAVRGEVAEDLRTAALLKGAGARLRIEYAPDLLRTRMQTNFSEIWEGFTKNLFAGAGFSFARALAGVAGLLLFGVVPPLVALCLCAWIVAKGGSSGVWAQLFVPTFLVWALQVIIFAFIEKKSGIPVVYALLVPLGLSMFCAVLLNSSLRIATGRGVTWKGRKLYEREGVRPPRARGRGLQSS